VAVRAARAAVVGAGVVVLVTLVASPAATNPAQLAGPPPDLVQFGYVRALVPSGSGFRMRFDPALWLSGETANRAAVEDGIIRPGETVPNDYYVRNDSRELLTYTVPASARVTVVTGGGGLRSTRIAVAELAAIVVGGNPKKRKLYGRMLGYWVRFVGDRALRLDQQYQP
jgi:hypothetical protein